MEHIEEISVWQSFFLIINRIFGTGMLSIPWAYTRGGILFGLISQLIVSIFSMILSYQFLQTMIRVSKIRTLISKGLTVNPVPLSKLFIKTNPDDFINTNYENLCFLETSDEVIEQRLDMTTMILLLFGKTHATISCLLFSIGSSVLLVVYSSIFGTSLASTVPILASSTCNLYDESGSFGNSCWQKYWLYLLVLLVFSSILVMVKLKVQAWFQGTLAVTRFFVALLIMATCIVALVQDKNLNNDKKNNGKVIIFNISGTGTSFSIILLANYFHTFIPNAVQFLKSRETNSTLVINMGNASVSVLYAFLGAIVSITVYQVEEMATLDWIGYTGGHSQQSWWSIIICYAVILLPVFSIFSAFPLVAINISDNMMTLFEIPDADKTSWKFAFFRIVFVAFPVSCSFFFYNIGIFSNIAGLFNMVNLGFYIPAQSIAAKKIISEKNEFDDWFSSFWISVIMIVVHCFVLIFSCSLIIIYYQ